MMAASMEAHCIPFTEIPHTAALFADALYRFPRVARFYAHDPFDPASFRAAAQAVALDAARRVAVADVLAEQNRTFGGGRETEENIARLRDGAVAVVTGQQVGLFGGPAYSVYKALTAIRLAEKLSADGLAAAPGFGQLFQRLFAGRGLIVLDPTHPALHAQAAPLYRRALEEAEKLHALLKERDKQLDKAGYHRQVRLRENATLLFLTENGRRLPLRRRRNGVLQAGDEERSAAQLLAALDSAPERFSPNVLLRPGGQGWMLLAKYRLGLPDLFRGEEALRQRLAERHLPPRLLRQLQESERKVEKLVASAAGAVKTLDPP